MSMTYAICLRQFLPQRSICWLCIKVSFDMKWFKKFSSTTTSAKVQNTRYKWLQIVLAEFRKTTAQLRKEGQTTGRHLPIDADVRDGIFRGGAVAQPVIIYYTKNAYNIRCIPPSTREITRLHVCQPAGTV